MADLREIVSRMLAAGESEENIALVIRKLSAPAAPMMPVSSHGGPQEDFAKYGPMQGILKDQANAPQLREAAKANAPAIGAGAAALATGGAGLIPAALAAAGGGAAGSLLRGDDGGTAITEGAIQGGLQAAGGGLSKLLAGVARPIYRAAIPKSVQDKFSRANLAQQGLGSRTVLGTKGGTRTATAASARAGQGIDAAASGVPSLTAQDIRAAFAPRHAHALTARRPDKALEVREHVRQSMGDIGSQPMTGRQQLARKKELEPESGSAMRAPNPNMAATNPQLANIERKAITRNLRRSPEMASALDTSQAAIGIQRAAKATENSSAINRLSNGGIWNAVRSPAAFSGGAIGINELSQVPFAQLLRMAQIAQLQDQE